MQRLAVQIATVLAIAAVAAAGAAEGRDAETFVLANRFIELGFTVADGKCSATSLVNKLLGRTIPIQADGFTVSLKQAAGSGGGPRSHELTPDSFAFRQLHNEGIPGGQRRTLEFVSKRNGIRLDIVYELGRDDPFIRRRLVFTAPKPIEPTQVTVWRVQVEGACAHQGFGEPVFLEDTFWGLEHPAGVNRYADGAVTLTHHPWGSTRRFVSKTAVVGVAKPGRVADRFRQYIATFKATSDDMRLFVNYNTWWTLMPPTEKNCLELIGLFKRKLFAPHGESFDTFTIDDGWDDKNSLWAIRKDRFPRGFAPLLPPLRAMKANLGLWLSPSSGYHHAPWLTTKGGYLKGTSDGTCVQSDPKYRRDIIDVVTRLAKHYDLAFYKFDGFGSTNQAVAPGHPRGAHAREANVDAFIDLLDAARKTNPRVFLDPTCGMWLSPWWLKHCDAIWGSVSGDYPDIIVPAPIVRDSATTTRDAIFRQRCREHPGFTPAAIEHLGIIVITPEKWEDNAIAVVGRGCRLLTLYINPKHFRNGDRDWAFLASLLKWTRHHAATLGHTTLIGGDPYKREVYGYAHFAGDRGIVCLRNPFIEPKTVKLKLDESVGWARADAKDAFAARIVYPRDEVLDRPLRHGDTLELKLEAYETMITHIERWSAGLPRLCGIRARETARAGNRANYAVHGRPGRSYVVTASLHVARVEFDSQPGLPIESELGSSVLLVAFPGQKGTCAVERARLEAQQAEGSWCIEGSCAATVPPGATATMHVLCDPSGGFEGALACEAKVNGKAVKVRAVARPKQRRQVHSSHAWTWFEFPVPAGRSEVAIAIRPSKGWGYFRGEVGWWLWAEHSLTKHTLTLEFDKPLPPAKPEPLPLPIAMDTEREIITIQKPTVFRAGSRWPRDDRRVVHLDEATPDESTQQWGTLQRNQSVWRKPMIVAGRKFARGLGTHANGRLAYDLSGGRFKTFRCQVGRDEHAGDGRIVFHVWLDGRKAFDSGPMTKTVAAKPVEVDVSGAKSLELRTLDGGDGISGDHGNWAEARLER